MKIRRIVGKSMEPTYYEGEVVLFKRATKYATGDVVMAIVDGNEVIKRISGSTEEKVYLLGDNPMNSTDSRDYGSIDVKQIYGRAFYKVPLIARRQSL